MKVRARKSRIFPKDAKGHYVEPAWVSKRLFEEEKFTGTIYDPACGWGTILREAMTAGFRVAGSDIVDRKRHKLARFSKMDFLKRTRPLGDDASVVCNPPFDHIEAFCRHALELGAQKVAMIMLIRRLNAAHWLQELPLRRIHLLTPRPSMPPGSWITAGNKPGGGTQDFCWLVFTNGYKGKPELRWLTRGGR